MGIFSSKSTKSRAAAGKTIIAEGCKISGELTDLKGDLHVDGLVEGIIETEFDISVGESGKISGLVKARSIAVSGVLEGKIGCERIDVLKEGKLLGNVICGEMMIEAGGKFIGESRELTEGGLIVSFPEIEEASASAQLTLQKKAELKQVAEKSEQSNLSEKKETKQKLEEKA